MTKQRIYHLLTAFLMVVGLIAYSAIRPAISQVRANTSSWQLEVVDDEKAFHDWGPRSLALDTQGHPHIVYGGDHLYYAVYDGARWSIETVDNGDLVGWYASLALDGDGHPHISYCDCSDGYLKYAYHDGSQWHIVTVDKGSVGGYTSIALDMDGHPHISYNDWTWGDGGLKYAYYDGSQWHIETVDSEGGEFTSLALDADGHPHIGYTVNGALKYAYNDGTQWHVETVDSDSNIWSSLSLVLDSNGHPHISYYYNNQDNWEIGALKYAYHDGTQWHIETVVSEGNGGYTSLALDADGHPHISYTVNGTLKYAYYDGSQWHTETVDDSGDGEYTSIALDADGHPRISYYGGDWENSGLKYAYNDGTQWHIEMVDSEGTGEGYTSLALGTDGHPRISYIANDGLKYAYYDGSQWYIEAVDAEGSQYTSLALDTDGHPHISYIGGGYIKYAYHDGTQWHVETVDSSGYGEYTSIALDSDGHPHISYTVDGNVKYAYYDGNQWHVEAVDGESGHYTSLALDADGHPHISYTGSGGIKYAYHDGTQWHVETVDSEGGEYTSLALDADGHPHISYYYNDQNYNNGDLKYAYYDGSQWHIETVDSAGSGGYTSLALDSDGHPHISYYVWSSESLKYAYSDGSQWYIETVDYRWLCEAKYTSLALDAEGYPHISYYDPFRQDLQYAWLTSFVPTPTATSAPATPTATATPTPTPVPPTPKPTATATPVPPTPTPSATLHVSAKNYRVSNVTSTAANNFNLWLDLQINGQARQDVCDNYTFVIEPQGEATGPVTQNGCTYGGTSPDAPGYSRYRVDFKIRPQGRAAYFENGQIKLCKRDQPTACVQLPGLEGFSFYGTTFEIDHNAWSFPNDPAGVWGRNKDIRKEFLKAADVLTKYIPPAERSLWWWTWKEGIPKIKETWSGLCYGMASAAIAQFTNGGTSYWEPVNLSEVNQTDEKKWQNAIEGRWDASKHQPKPPYQPLPEDDLFSSKYVRGETRGEATVEAGRKVMYYFLSQPTFGPTILDIGHWDHASSWVGWDQLTRLDESSEGQVDTLLKSGAPVLMMIRLKWNSGHAIAVVAKAEWNGHHKYFIWDNNYHFYTDLSCKGTEKWWVLPWMSWYVPDGNRYEAGEIVPEESIETECRNKVTLHLSGLPEFLPLHGDSQGIYGFGPYGGNKPGSAEGPGARGAARLNGSETVAKRGIWHPYPRHVLVTLVGAGVEEVRRVDTGETVTVVPGGEIEPGRASLLIGMSGDVQSLALPADAVYQIKARKDAAMPFAGVYATIPYPDGTVEVLNYDQVVAAGGQVAQLSFRVGRGNTDKGITITPEDQGGSAERAQAASGPEVYEPDFDANEQMSLLPPENFQGYYQGGAAHLQWMVPAQGNVDHIVVVRNSAHMPDGPDDGTVVYSGLDESVVDSGVTGRTYYAAFSVDSSGQASEGVYLVIDPGEGSVVGQVSVGGTPVSGVVVKVLDGEGRVADVGSTDKSGRYAVSGLVAGEYHVEVSKPGYEFTPEKADVEVRSGESQEADFSGETVAALWFVGVPEEITQGDDLVLTWGYRNLPADAKLRLKVRQDGGEWETVATGIPATGGVYVVKGVNARDQVEARLEWEGDSAVGAEAVVNVVARNVFSDVADDHWAVDFINRLYRAGVTGGCALNPLRYCPDNPVTRAQMAVFLEKGMHYPNSYSPPDVKPTFPDTAGHWAEDWIEALKSDGITSGFPDGTYRPESPVTRAQMAVFLLKAKHGASYQPPAVDHSRFSDVPDGHWAKAWIEELAAEGITSGYPDGTYRPENPVSRAEMSVFLVKTFELP